MNNSIENPDLCCGCSACAQKCPEKCIQIQKDENGFWKPFLNSSYCINCGTCLSVCPVFNKQVYKNEQVFYIAVARDKKKYQQGASGGIFPVIASEFLISHGIVWGCGYDEQCLPIHKCISSENELDDLCRSKYSQSNTKDVFTTIEKQLKSGLRVLFCGTPCQVGGLKNYLGKEYCNLLLVDILCHGVPSASFLEKQIKFVEKKYKKKISRFEFREKTDKNDIYYMTYLFYDGTKVSVPYYKDIYYNSFYQNKSLNEICYQCPYAQRKRTGDITLGDYEWGKKYHREFDLYNELSCLIVNTEKGNRFFSTISEKILYEKTNIEWIEERNRTLIEPTRKPSEAKDFYKEIFSKDYDQLVKKYYLSREYWTQTKCGKRLLKTRTALFGIKKD